MNIKPKQQEIFKKTKNTIQKSTKAITSRMLYVFLGLFFSISIYAVNAAWNSSVAGNQTLTSTLWNDLKDRVVLLNSYWSLSGSTLSTPYTVYAPAYTGPGCDIAERYQTSDNNSLIEPGDLVVLDKDNEMSIKKSDKAYSAMVIGVISTNPNLTMGTFKYSNDKDYPPVALLGRVPTKVIVENGSIEIGDNIVSSSKPGYGMRCDDYDKCKGAIIGKALQKLDSGEGIIEVLIKAGL
ncbi:MAG: hypothetical protein V1825_04485 [Candidatus Falkowbacteria bacterium]